MNIEIRSLGDTGAHVVFLNDQIIGYIARTGFGPYCLYPARAVVVSEDCITVGRDKAAETVEPGSQEAPSKTLQRAAVALVGRHLERAFEDGQY